MLKSLALPLILTLPLTLFSQWTNLGTQSLPIAITSDYHAIRFTNVPGPTPANGSVWTAYRTDDDWVTETTQATGGGGSLGCCAVEFTDFLNDSLGFATVSNMGLRSVHRTTDAGTSWQPWAQALATASAPLADLQAFSDTVAYLIGHGNGALSTKALRFTPTGYNMVFESMSLEGEEGRIHFVNDSLGLLIVRDANQVYKVLRTTDGGLTWATRLSVGIGNLRALQMLDAQTGFVAGASGVCYKTTDGGDTWNGLAINGPVNVNAMHFLDEQTGYLACSGGIILRTTNGGQFWANDQLDTNATLVYVKAVSASIAYVMDADSVLFKRNYIAGDEAESAAAQGIEVYPNPTAGWLNLALPANDPLLGWQLWNLQGKLLLQGKHPAMDIAELSAGIYLLQVQTRTGTQVIRIQRQ